MAVLRRVSVAKSLWYSWRLDGRVLVGRGSKVRLGSGCSARFNDGFLLVGLAPQGEQGAVLELGPRSTFEVQGLVQLLAASVVRVGWDARLSIGDRTYLNAGARITCGYRLDIGARCAIAPNVQLMDTDTHLSGTLAEQGVRHAAVSIADDCWIATSAVVLKGASVGQGSIIAAGSVVASGVFPARSLLAGVPARVIRTGVSWHL
jgi:acetyltransferase-like isoleucine patch superfamily enzyme